MNLLKLVRAVRVTRVLRLLRVLKIFGKIENVASKMAHKQVQTISTLVILSGVLVYSSLSMGGFLPLDDSALSARFSLMLSILLISAVLVLAVVYTAYFSKTVSDPVYIMQRGFQDKDYNLAVRILKTQKDTELFNLAASYNRLWLPLKARLLDAHRQKAEKNTRREEDYSDLL